MHSLMICVIALPLTVLGGGDCVGGRGCHGDEDGEVDHRAVAGAGVVMVDRTMLASRRALFEVPRDICYLNAASYSPLPLKTIEAGRAAVLRKGQPWTLSHDFANAQHERARSAAARLINADSDDIALISSVGYGVSTAAKLVTIPRGCRVIVLENDHSSPVLEWYARRDAQGLVIETVSAPDDGDWTSAVL